MFIFTFVQSSVLVLIESTYFHKFSDYDFSKAFTLQKILVRMWILIPGWTTVPKMEQKRSPQIISLQIAPNTCKMHHYIRWCFYF